MIEGKYVHALESATDALEDCVAGLDAAQFYFRKYNIGVSHPAYIRTENSKIVAREALNKAQSLLKEEKAQ